MSTKLILIRHGQTDWSLQERYCGFTDVGLNEKGRFQARQLFKGLSKETIHKVYSSNTKRTRQFAEIVCKSMPIEELSGLREINFGIFEGLRYHEIMNRYPEIYKKWLDNPCDISIPRGEGLCDLAARVNKALVKILSNNTDKTIAVFTHAGPIRVILCDTLKLRLGEIWQIEVDLASISIIEFGGGRGKILLLNDTSYLKAKELQNFIFLLKGLLKKQSSLKWAKDAERSEAYFHG
ncbi:MAG: histidine phosphatase family protein [Omnitrophica bacterium]|nr:histidine phosphatase family protein [Candidatus Omnitrophota bacterium]